MGQVTLTTIRGLARALDCRLDQAEDVVRSEPSARAALSRRGLFQAAGAVAAGSLFFDATVVSAGGPIYAMGDSWTSSPGQSNWRGYVQDYFAHLSAASNQLASVAIYGLDWQRLHYGDDSFARRQ